VFEAAAALLFAHVLADFVCQTSAMIAAKRRPAVFAQHVLVVAITATLCLGAGSGAGWGALIVIVISHALVDAGKTFLVPGTWITAAPFRALLVFGLDQLAHLLFIALAATLFSSAFSDGVWPQVLSDAGRAGLIVAYVAASGFWIAVRVGDLALALFMDAVRAPDTTLDSREPALDGRVVPDRRDELRGGAWIGRLERALVFLLVLLGQFNAIGFVIAAKSILRFEYARHARHSEMVIIGTLSSFGWAIITALLTDTALAVFRA